jgi:hypothetical protein
MRNVKNYALQLSGILSRSPALTFDGRFWLWMLVFSGAGFLLSLFALIEISVRI